MRSTSGGAFGSPLYVERRDSPSKNINASWTTQMAGWLVRGLEEGRGKRMWVDIRDFAQVEYLYITC